MQLKEGTKSLVNIHIKYIFSHSQSIGLFVYFVFILV